VHAGVLRRASRDLDSPYAGAGRLAPGGAPCKGDTSGLLARYPVTASSFHLIGKETERGWEQSEDISTLLPSPLHYEAPGGTIGNQLQEKLRDTPLDVLEEATGLSRHTLVRARRGQRVNPRSLHVLKVKVGKVSVRKR
jgi:hypothetical protein